MKCLKEILKKTFIFTIYRKISDAKNHVNETYGQKAKRLSKKYPTEIYWGQEGNDRILELLNSKTPVFITRYGGTELRVIYPQLIKQQVPDIWKSNIQDLSGFFPVNNKTLSDFANLYFESSKKIDAVAVWFNDGESKMIKKFCPKSLLVELGVLNSFLHKNPYTQILKNKKVLVIHPFENTILTQLPKREKLFADKDVLPQCEITIIKAPQTVAGNTDGYKSWFDAYEDTCRKIKNADFDIALLGCGAYGLPLGAYIKSLGKTAIHIGGALQLLFGIKGRRWTENDGYDKTWYNEYWISPLPEDRPVGAEKVEGATYW